MSKSNLALLRDDATKDAANCQAVARYSITSGKMDGYGRRLPVERPHGLHYNPTDNSGCAAPNALPDTARHGSRGGGCKAKRILRVALSRLTPCLLLGRQRT